MNNTSFQDFVSEMSKMYMSFNRNAPDPAVCQVWYERLMPYRFSDVRYAFMKAASEGYNSAHPPSLPQIIASMPSGIMKIDGDYLMAQLHHTTSTVGALFRSEVGSMNIRQMGDPAIDRVVSGKLKGFLARLPAMQQEITCGRGFNGSQMKVLLAEKFRGLDVCEFAGYRISSETIALNRERAKRIRESGAMLEHQPVVDSEKKAVPAPEVANFINGILSQIDTPSTPQSAIDLLPCGKCGAMFESILSICPKCEERR